jgi:hypothetical protein
METLAANAIAAKGIFTRFSRSVTQRSDREARGERRKLDTAARVHRQPASGVSEHTDEHGHAPSLVKPIGSDVNGRASPEPHSRRPSSTALVSVLIRLP